MPEPQKVEEKKVPCRRWRVSLRTLMVLILCLAAWLGYEGHLAREQRKAVQAIKAYGGFVAYDWEYVGDKQTPGRRPLAPGWIRRAIGDEYFQDVVEVNLTYGTAPDGKRIETTRTTDDVISRLCAFPALKYLYIHETQATDGAMDVVGKLRGLEVLMMWDAAVTDAGMAKLKGLTNLKNIHVSKAGLGDESLKHLAGLPRLEHLSLQDNRFTDKGLAHIRDMTNLKSLVPDLGKTDITDAGMAHLRKLTKLEQLGLQRTKVTDAGLKELTGLVNLKELWVSGSRITPDGSKRFKAEMPNLKTVR